ncbi:MAG TPA: hypothetical protein GXX29_08335 [Firmicutes bacterium]|nr:hypothetical protein [Bacillota bacterium]
MPCSGTGKIIILISLLFCTICSFFPEAAAADPPASDRLTIKVMTYNIRHGRGLDDEVNLDRVAWVIKAYKPDIVLLNEVDFNNRRSGQVDQTSYLAGLLGLPYSFFGPAIRRPYVADWSLQSSAYGNALLSRFPIIAARAELLPPWPRMERRSLIVADIHINENTTLRFFGTHLGLHAGERYRHVQHIAELAAESSLPKLLAGDFNALPDSREIAYLKEMWTDPAPHVHEATYPSLIPTYRIDYIFTSGDLAANIITYQVVPGAYASDHLPVILEIRL